MAEGEDVITPIVEYMDDNKDPENYAKVCVDIPGLKKKPFGEKPKNAEVEFKADERSFTLRVTVNDTSPPKTYVYKVKQLPEAIVPDAGKSYTTVKRKEEVVVYLRKARAGKWERMLRNVGLETFSDR